MTFALQTLIVRSRRRVRVIFTDAVAIGAFSTSFFSITSSDGVGASPSLNGALMVPDSAQAVELSLAQDLADSGNFTLNVVSGVPALAGGTAAAATYAFKAPAAPPPPSPELPSDDSLDAIYGNDIMFSNDDFVETAEGDLAVGGGVQNVVDALVSRGLSNGLPWDGTYGAKPREYVDGADTGIPVLRATMIGQFLQDDRVSLATGSSSTDTSGDATISIDVVLVGQNNPVNVPVPVSDA